MSPNYDSGRWGEWAGKLSAWKKQQEEAIRNARPYTVDEIRRALTSQGVAPPAPAKQPKPPVQQREPAASAAPYVLTPADEDLLRVQGIDPFH